MHQPTTTNTNMQQPAADYTTANMQQPMTTKTNMAHLNGRVFNRLQQFKALPKDLQTEVARLEEHLSSIQRELFDTHRTLTLKSVYGARAGHLLEKIEAWTKTYDESTYASKGTDRMDIGNYQTATARSAATDKMPVMPPGPDHTAGHHSPHAKKLLDALVLKGFLTPKKEKKPDEVTSAVTDDLDFKDTDLLVAVGKNITAPTSSTSMTTVWDMVDGAVFAGMVKRKANIIEKLAHGKDVYVMVNSRLKNITIFSKDVSRKPLLQLDANSLNVALDMSHFEHGVKTWNQNDTEVLSASSAHESDELMHALESVGATQNGHHGNAHGVSGSDKVRRDVNEVVGRDGVHSHTHGATTHGSTDPHHPVESLKNKMKPNHEDVSGQPTMGHIQTDDHAMGQGASHNHQDMMNTTQRHAVNPTDRTQTPTHQREHGAMNTAQDPRTETSPHTRNPVESLKNKVEHGIHGSSASDPMQPIKHEHNTMKPANDHAMGQQMDPNEYAQTGQGMGEGQYNKTQPTMEHMQNAKLRENAQDQVPPNSQGNYMP